MSVIDYTKLCHSILDLSSADYNRATPKTVYVIVVQRLDRSMLARDALAVPN
jgi:hypothetical protein